MTIKILNETNDNFMTRLRKSSYEAIELSGGFILYYNDAGHWIGVKGIRDEMEASFQITQEIFKCMKIREGRKK